MIPLLLQFFYKKFGKSFSLLCKLRHDTRSDAYVHANSKSKQSLVERRRARGAGKFSVFNGERPICAGIAVGREKEDFGGRSKSALGGRPGLGFFKEGSGT